MQKMVENFIQVKMPDEVIKKIEGIFKSKKISKGEIVVHVGDIQNEVYFILSGLLRSYYIDISGNDVTHFFRRKGTLCIGEALFYKGPSKHCVEAVAWAISKGTVPIIGVTKESHIDGAASALNIDLEIDEIIKLEEAARDTGISIKGGWEKSMI